MKCEVVGTSSENDGDQVLALWELRIYRREALGNKLWHWRLKGLECTGKGATQEGFLEEVAWSQGLRYDQTFLFSGDPVFK